MSKLSPPVGIVTDRKDVAKITVTWDKTGDGTGKKFNFHFIGKKDGKIEEIEESKVTVDTTGKDKYTAIITVTTADHKDQLVEVQAKATVATDTDSDWGRETIWTAGASLVIVIGGKEYTLTTDGGNDSTIYKLPVSEASPLTITYEDLKEFAKAFDLTLPENLPGGLPTALDIYELAVDTSKKTFAIDIAVKFDGKELIPGLKIKRVGFVIRRTDGTRL